VSNINQTWPIVLGTAVFRLDTAHFFGVISDRSDQIVTFGTDRYRISGMRLIRALSCRDPALWRKLRSDLSLYSANASPAFIAVGLAFLRCLAFLKFEAASPPTATWSTKTRVAHPRIKSIHYSLHCLHSQTSKMYIYILLSVYKRPVSNPISIIVKAEISTRF
jgi:hypothetical protein